MDQLLNTFDNIQNIGGEDGVLGGADISAIVVAAGSDLARDVDHVLATEDADGQSQDQEPAVDKQKSFDARVARCKERQIELESKFAKLSSRISALRGYHLGNHASQQIQIGIMCCEKKLLRGKPASSLEENKELEEADEKLTPDNGQFAPSRPGVGGGGGQSVSARPEPAAAADTETKVRRPKMREVWREHANQTLGSLHAHLKHVQKFADPDATESSSGGESGDEHEKFNVGATMYAPIKERAKYRYLQKRSEHARQWGWVQSQISDLEFKIRQQTEMYKAYREAKGAVSLGDPQYQRIKGQDSDDENVCVRHRPLNRFKRRKVLDTYCLHHVNSKLNKPSGVTCSCLLPDEWCVLCFGRRQFRLSADIHTQSRNECTALLDHSYHAVLSTQDCVPISTVLAEAAHKKRWLKTGSVTGSQNIPLHLSTLMDINEKIREPAVEGGAVKRKSGRSRGEERASKRRRVRVSSLNQKEGCEGLTNTVMKEIREIKDVRELARIKDMIGVQDGGRKKRKNSFDIDHVVIPYNMSTTRVEKPKYKEIQTPSWREVDPPYPWPPMGSTKRLMGVRKPPQPPRPSCEDSDYEDVSVLAISLLHAKAEEEERIRWATPLGRVPGGQRTRANRVQRLDSCVTEASSEVNTPDPLSPGFIDRVEDIVVQTRPSSPQEEGLGTPGLVSPAEISSSTASLTTAVTSSAASSTAGSTATLLTSAVTSAAASSTAGITASPLTSAAASSTAGITTSSLIAAVTTAAASSTAGITASSLTSAVTSAAASSTAGITTSSLTSAVTSASASSTAGNTTTLLTAASSTAVTSTAVSMAPTSTASGTVSAAATSLSQDSSTSSLTITPSGVSSSQTSGNSSQSSSSLTITPAVTTASSDSLTASSKSLPSAVSLKKLGDAESGESSAGITDTVTSLATASTGSLSSDSGISLASLSTSSLETCRDDSVRMANSLADSRLSSSTADSKLSSSATDSVNKQGSSAKLPDIQEEETGKSSASASAAGQEDPTSRQTADGSDEVGRTPVNLKIRRRTCSQSHRTSRNRNLSEASQGSSRCTSPVSGGGDHEVAETISYEPRQFPLTDDEVKLLEEEEEGGMLPPPPRTIAHTNLTSVTPSISTARLAPTTALGGSVAPTPGGGTGGGTGGIEGVTIGATTGAILGSGAGATLGSGSVATLGSGSVATLGSGTLATLGSGTGATLGSGAGATLGSGAGLGTSSSGPGPSSSSFPRSTPTPPPSTATSRTTSRATSPSSSVTDPDQDPDWEQEDDDSDEH